MKRIENSHRRWLGVAAGASLAVTAVVPMAMAGSANTEPATDDSASAEVQVADEVLTEIQSAGVADFWVHFDNRPDLSHAANISDWGERGQVVVDALKEAAAESQSDVLAQLDAEGVEHQAFFITNAIKVTGASQETLDEIVTASGVGGIYAPFEVEMPEFEVGTEEHRAPNAVEWGVADINADQVWDEYGVTGEGIVVGSIDTGAQWDHPALIDSYRGNNGDGTADHNYNWFDADGSSPDEPADTHGHGTHVTGTMAGDDGGDNQIGVAPGATWIAANGCCPSDEALVTSGEWMLEPTDLDGENPDTSQRPHIVNNSWGTIVPSNDPFMEEIFLAWGDAGMFGVFSNGNDGQLGCESSGAPGSLTSSYSVGNYQANHDIAASSARGPGEDGTMKPNISAPGTNIRSAVPGDNYAPMSGTSMASPHVAGAVALLWSGAPDLVGDWEETRNLLNQTAIDTENLECGGTAENNNVFGEGRLDVMALMEAAPIDEDPEEGVLYGVVTDDSDDSPIEGAEVVIEGPVNETVTTDADGAYSVTVEPGGYNLTASADGYLAGTGEGVVEEGEETEVNIALEPDDGDPGDPELDIDRLFGDDRYATAANLSAATHEPGAPVVFIATGEEFADALTGSALAGEVGAPVLLVRNDHLPQATAAELERLDPEAVAVFGSEERIENSVLEDIAAAAGTDEVERAFGDDRYETAAVVSLLFGSVDTVYVARGDNFPDALAAAALTGVGGVGALANPDGAPVLLVQPNHLPQATAAALVELDPDQIVVLGNEDSVSQDVEDLLAEVADVTRLAGDDRWGTAVAVSETYDPADVNTFYLATGERWPDALTGAALARQTGQPLLLAKQDEVPDIVVDEIIRLAPDGAVLFGDTDALGVEVEEQLQGIEFP